MQSNIWLAMLICAAMPTFASRASCDLNKDELIGLERILAGDWLNITRSNLPLHWPSATPWSMHASAQSRCNGTFTLLNLEQVTANECRCCDAFVFDETPSSNEACGERLSTVTITRRVNDLPEAKAMAKRFKEVLAIVPDTQFRHDGLEFTSVAWPTKTISQTANFTVERLPDGYMLRLAVHRVPIPISP